ncbi:DUF5677 domain-containing protein [Flagellimonas baculiformis]|uniref:DUF5677 domain-containing protein n=1 Tax=Flagellimonas baculiformis TaxID=3067310 RepID=UPI00296F0FAC|nr:DUF5677 domain-containing protein [Muricauda sp. D6]
MDNEKSYKSVSGYPLEDLKHFHQEASNFFASELMMLKEVIPKISDERQAKAALLLISCTQTGAALLQLANQPDTFTSESVMLSRAFMEKITNFCYVSICEEKEYRAFILHPIYKYYHSIGALKYDDLEFPRESGLNNGDFMDILNERKNERKREQDNLKKSALVKEALEIFSETKPNLPWTRKPLNERIKRIEKWGKLMDVFFTLSKIEYYSDASESLHGSLYGCSYGVGGCDPDFEIENEEEIDKKLFRDNACNLLSLGMLIHETLTLISHSSNIKEIWNHSFKNRGMALNLHSHIMEWKIPRKRTKS